MSHAGLGTFMQAQRESTVDVELAYAMNEIFNMKKELKRVYDLVHYHAPRGNLVEESAELMKISKGVAKAAGSHTLAFRIDDLLLRMMRAGINPF